MSPGNLSVFLSAANLSGFPRIQFALICPTEVHPHPPPPNTVREEMVFIVMEMCGGGAVEFKCVLFSCRG